MNHNTTKIEGLNPQASIGTSGLLKKEGQKRELEAIESRKSRLQDLIGWRLGEFLNREIRLIDRPKSWREVKIRSLFEMVICFFYKIPSEILEIEPKRIFEGLVKKEVEKGRELPREIHKNALNLLRMKITGPYSELINFLLNHESLKMPLALIKGKAIELGTIREFRDRVQTLYLLPGGHGVKEIPASIGLLTNIKTVWAADLGLEKVDNLGFLGNLEKLYMSNNKIGELNIEVIKKLPKLTLLAIDNNGLKEDNVTKLKQHCEKKKIRLFV